MSFFIDRKGSRFETQNTNVKRCTEKMDDISSAPLSEKAPVAKKFKANNSGVYFASQSEPKELQNDTSHESERKLSIVDSLEEKHRSPKHKTKSSIQKQTDKQANTSHKTRHQAKDKTSLKDVYKDFTNVHSAGFVQADDSDPEMESFLLTQKDIVAAVDISSKHKHFSLHLPREGPFRLNYSRNGRNILLGGRKGHLSAIDWFSKKLKFETNVDENIRDISWLHNESMCAVAQQKWLHIYDSQGVELHCIKQLESIQRMVFLPYHFLLTCISQRGFLSYLDVSMGKIVSQIVTKRYNVSVMEQNPKNAVIHTGYSNGQVELWTPSSKESVVKILCHNSPIRGLAIDTTGWYMATAGQDQRLKIFDIRTYRPLQNYKIPSGASHLNFSQSGLLAIAFPHGVDIYQDCCKRTAEKPYLSHKTRTSQMGNIQFCPYEDVLGVAHGEGFVSVIVPGAGEPNFDAIEVNPYSTKSQRREMEIKSLLDKVQPEMITIDSGSLGKVNKIKVSEQMAQKGWAARAHSMKTKRKANGKSMRKEKLKERAHQEQVRNHRKKINDKQ